MGQIDFEQYPTIIYSGRRYSKIPIADLLPPDFKDVILVNENNAPIKGYYSPAYNALLKTDNDQKLNIENIKGWLRAVK